LLTLTALCAYKEVDVDYMSNRLKAFLTYYQPTLHYCRTIPIFKGLNAHYHVMREENYNEVLTIEAMRKLFAEMLFNEMASNPDIYLLTGDLGYGLWDQVRDTYPNRFYNVGSSEMAMMGMGIGLAMEGKIPYIYSITPFAIYRPFEMIRNYLDHENIPVNIVGGGRDKEYGYLGFSHWAHDDKRIMVYLIM
jgi:transketolase